MRKITTKWTCKDGTRVRICDMSDTHLLNTIRMLRRADRAELNSAYSVEMTLQGEIAQDCIARDIRDMEENPLEDRLPIYDLLTRDAERRKLKL